MRKGLAALVGIIALVSLTAAAEARSIRYHAQHPIPAKFGGGFCYITEPHVHAFGPSDPRLYRMHDEEYYFVGDPTPFGYDGPRYSYYGPHPVVDVGVEFGEPVYCYLDGPHYHWYQPVAQAQFEFRGGAYWYVGDYDPIYYRQRGRYVAINEAYRPVVWERPVVDVTVAPPAFHGVIVAGPGVHGHAVVAAPAFSAVVHVEEPPPASIHVGVGVGVGGPLVVGHGHVIVAEPPPRTVIIREHHDNGRHEGWYKHGKH